MCNCYYLIIFCLVKTTFRVPVGEIQSMLRGVPMLGNMLSKSFRSGRLWNIPE